jgi:catechol-2,3-dioxygenase
MKILGIAWLGFVSDNPDMRRFYGEVLGLPLDEETEEMAYYRINETSHLEILSTDSATANNQKTEAPAVAFLVADLDAAATKLQAAGTRASSEIREWSSPEETHRWLYFEDPEGNILLLMERS